MNKEFIYINTIRTVFFLILQIFLFNILPIGIFYIMVYPAAILLFPNATRKVLIVIIAFSCGFILDWFSNGNGLHTASLTFLGYSRSYILEYIRPISGWTKIDVPNIYQQGFKWVATYTTIAIIIHHSVYFFLESFSAINVLFTLKKMVLSSIMSIAIILLINLLFLKNNKL